ncbi:hypothetical protein AB0L71_19940 [Streptomyces sp. NPDC052052]|uniref:hypothetical protein n=1 Tax=Streptomyces sp. NPDC052052 TaxID=3154756 RepID=UPI0034307585
MADPTPTRPSGPAAKADVPHAADLPLDTETAAQAADDALRLRLGTITRQEIDVRTAELRGCVGLLTEKVFDRAPTTATRSIREEVDQLLTSAPADDTLVFHAFQHLRDLARMLHRLVAEHGKWVETADGDEPVRPHPPLVGSAAEHKALPTKEEMGA